ncbi:RNA-directed DNA polymerase [Carboxylicivirga sp. RSCT41]|uniref:RNA-directed DNA polymerase n=1 Tax=Carboxylicivirga agarovorans TaxID=3417570 RepID=UPI003D35358D
MSIRITRPNKYVNLTKEISSEELLKGLLGFGLFADKLPDFLTNEPFYEWYIANSKPSFENKGKDYVRYENMRHVNVPRLLGIPNPFAYANLCNELTANWDNLKSKLITNVKNQKFKVSRIHIRKLTDKNHLFEMNYNHHEKDGNPEQKIIIGKQYVVEADISNCFPSIYSHSIPWALVGKKTAKVKKDDNSKWYNKLDKFIRNTKCEETNGLLIGPHSSNLISELILTKVDSVLCEKGYEYIRNIDDYKCFVKSEVEAEKFLLDLSSELKNYELHLNNKKTLIKQLPQASISEWVNKLSNFDLGHIKDEAEKEILELKRLRAILDTAIELMLKDNNSAIINYAIKIISKKVLKRHAYKYYIDSVHHLLLLYPYLSSLVDEFVFEPFEVIPIRIKKIAMDLYDVGIEKRFYEANCYSIYWALKYDFKIGKNIIQDSLVSNDCIFMTLAFLYSKKYKSKSSLSIFKSKAKSLAKTDFDRYWIFIYTTLPQPELVGDFKRIKKAKVSFIQPKFEK